MPAVASSSNLVELIQTLHDQQAQYAESTAEVAKTLEMQQRQQEEDAAQIAATLSKLSGLLSSLLGGFAPSSVNAPAKTPARAVAPAKAMSASKAAAAVGKPARRGRRGRGSFAQSGLESVLAFVKKHGNPSSSDVADHWTSEGRGGKADNTLGQLVKNKQIKRAANTSGRGSRYTPV